MPQTILKKVILTKQIRRADFLKFMSARKKRDLLRQSSYLVGKRVVHINAVADGGGVAEILASLIPYLRSLSVESDWYFINPDVGKRFFEITNKIHNALQGAPVKISGREWAEYKEISRRIAEELEKIDCDILAINDSQLLLAGHLAHLTKHKIYFSSREIFLFFEPKDKNVLEFTFLSCIGLV